MSVSMRSVLIVGLASLLGPSVAPVSAQGFFQRFNRVEREEQQDQDDEETEGDVVNRGSVYQLRSPYLYQQPGLTYAPAPATQSLVPSTQYPGYYHDPSNPGQLYYYPGQMPAATATLPATAPAVTPIAPPSATVPTNTAPIRKIAVKFVNPEEYGVPIHFAIDGTVYNVPSGYTQSLDVTATSILEFDRGEGQGNTRYSLSAGTYEFKYSGTGWQCYKKSSPGQVPNIPVIANGPPPNAKPRTVSGLARNATTPATTTDPSGLVPTSYTPVPPIPNPVPPR